MSTPAQVDYDALAKQSGAVNSAAPSVDYDALAKQSGAVSSDAGAEAAPAAANPDTQAPRNTMQRVKDSLASSNEAIGKGIMQGAQAPMDLLSGLNEAITKYEQTGKTEHHLFKPDEDKTMVDKIINPIKRLLGHLNPLPPDEGQGLPNRVLQGTAATATAALVGGAVGDGVGGAKEGEGDAGAVPKHEQLHPAEAAEKITDAVNPAAKDMPKFQTNMTKQVGRIKAYADANKIPLDTRDGLLKAAQGAQKQQTTLFYDKLLKPIADEQASTAQVKGYQGGTIGEGRTATLKQLDRRLTEINATLNPTYAKGGAAAEAAVNAEQHASLTAEAAGIRKVLYEEMGKKLGVDPSVVQQIRQNIGELNHIADRTEFALNQERHAKNASDRAPVTVNPLGKGTDRFVGDKVVNKVANAVRGNPAEKGIAEAFRRVNAPAPTEPNIQIKPKAKTTANVVERQPKPEPNVETPGPEAAAAMAEKLAERAKQVQSNKQAAAAAKAKNAASHGKGYQAAGEVLGTQEK